MCLEQEHQEHNPRSKNTNPDIKKKIKKIENELDIKRLNQEDERSGF